MSTERTRFIGRRISRTNAVLAVLVVIGAGISAAAGELVAAAVLAVAGAAIVVSAMRARSSGSDVARLHTGELVDERDRQLFTRVMAAVGVVSLVTTYLAWIGGMLLLEPWSFGWAALLGLVLVQALTWIIAGAVVARRG